MDALAHKGWDYRGASGFPILLLPPCPMDALAYKGWDYRGSVHHGALRRARFLLSACCSALNGGSGARRFWSSNAFKCSAISSP